MTHFNGQREISNPAPAYKSRTLVSANKLCFSLRLVDFVPLFVKAGSERAISTQRMPSPKQRIKNHFTLLTTKE